MKLKIMFIVVFFVFLVSCGEDENNPVIGSDDKVTVTDFMPKTQIEGGEISIYGSGFCEDKNKIRVFFGSKEAEILNLADTIIQMKVPEGIENVCPITVLKNGKSYRFDTKFQKQKQEQYLEITNANFIATGIMSSDTNAYGLYKEMEFNFRVDSISRDENRYKFYRKYFWWDNPYNHSTDTLFVDFNINLEKQLFEDVNIKYCYEYKSHNSSGNYRMEFSLKQLPFFIQDDRLFAKMDKDDLQNNIENYHYYSYISKKTTTSEIYKLLYDSFFTIELNIE